MIHRTINYKSADILLPLYKTLIRPLVEYCTPAWSPHYIKDKTLLEKVQCRFTRMITGLKLLNYNSRLDALNLGTQESSETELISSSCSRCSGVCLVSKLRICLSEQETAGHVDIH